MRFSQFKIKGTLTFSVFLVFLLNSNLVFGQETSGVFGKVTDYYTLKGLEGANITIKESLNSEKVVGFTTNRQGGFSFFTRYPLPFTLQVTMVGYEAKEIQITEPTTENLDIRLTPTDFVLDEFIVSGSKVEQERLTSPLLVEKLGIIELMQTASISVFDAIGNIRGVDVVTQSMVLNTVNTRGFNSTANTRFVQFSDGMDTQAPGLNFSLGNVAGIPDIDVESVELIPGPTSALYGPGAFNGVLSILSKSPFDFQGLSFTAKTGINGMESGGNSIVDFGGSPVREASIRYAKAFNDKFAFKLTGSLLKATDFRAENYSNIGVGLPFETFADNPGIDGLNIYGDEITNRLPIGGNDSLVVVNRTGYREEDLVDYKIENIRALASLHYKFSPKTELILQGNYGTITTMLTGDNRIFLRDFSIYQTKAEIKGEKLNLKGYMTGQNSGDSYDAGLLAVNMIRAAKPDEYWFQHFITGMRISSGGNYSRARDMADSGFGIGQNFESRYTPGTSSFDSLKLAIQNSSKPGYGAKIVDRSKLYNVDGSYILDEISDFAKFTVGGNYRFFTPVSDGTIFTDSANNEISVYEYGAFVQATKDILDKDLYFTASIRYDKNENFKGQFNPRISVVHTVKKVHNLRMSFTTGVRFPSVREQFFNQNLGDTRLVGGLPKVVNQYDLGNNAFTEQGLERFNEAVIKDITLDPINNPDPLGQNQAYLRHLNILEQSVIKPNQIKGIRPERVTTLEFGYKNVFEKRRYVDVTVYRNYYNDFIGVIRLIKPRTSPGTDLFASALQANNSPESDNVFIFGNSNAQIITQGIEGTYDVTSPEGINFAINATYAKLLKTDENDPIVPSFNTPLMKTNLSIGHRRATENFGFNLVWRFRSEFLWESAFADGIVDDYNTFDVQLTYRLPKINSSIRAGGMNIFNEKFVNAYGGPGISSIWHLTYTFDPFFFR
ncbi:TonB-dependent receptor [Peijinzhouia sedimentorum]